MGTRSRHRTLVTFNVDSLLHLLTPWYCRYWEHHRLVLRQLSGAGRTNQSLLSSTYSISVLLAMMAYMPAPLHGFVISEEHPFLGALPDAEVKCPYSCRQLTPVEACSRPNFCCTLPLNGNVPGLKLRKDPLYYSQVQGQMGVTKRKWCDLIVYTEKGLSACRMHQV